MSLKHHIEQEIKLTAPDQACLDALIDSPLVHQHLHHSCTQPGAQRFSAIYYDTEDWALRELRWSLRSRYEGARHVGTLKRNSTLQQGFSRCEEIEQPIEQAFRQVGCLPAGKIADALQSILHQSTPLLPRVEVDMQRRKRILQLGDTLIEMVTDAGQISANGRSVTLFEVELERLEGNLDSATSQAFCAQLSKAFALRSSRQSKHQIGLSLYQP